MNANTDPPDASSSLEHDPISRRRAIQALAGTGILGLAGCTGSDDDLSGNDVEPSDDRQDHTDDSGDDTSDDGADHTSNEPEDILVDEPIQSDRVTFATWEEIDAIRGLIEAGEDPWARAFQFMMSGASEALGATPRSVVDSGTPYGGDSAHQFATDAPYQGQDGVFDESTNREDASAAHDMSHWIRSAALAYAFTGDDRYAERAIDLLYHWCLDPNTYMEPTNVNAGPHTRNYQGNWGIDMYTSIPGMFYGASLVHAHPYWEEYGGVDQLDEWAAEMLENTEQYGVASGSNGTSWRAVHWLTFAAYLDDQESLRRGYVFWMRGFLDLDENGYLTREHGRTTSLRYSLYALEAILLGAEIARRQGVDLYNYSPEILDGSGVRAIGDAHAEYALDPSGWPHDQLRWSTQEYRLASYPYTLLHSEWPEDHYLEVVEQGGRLHEHRTVAVLSLLHGNQFENGIDHGETREGIPAQFDATLEFAWVNPGGETEVIAHLYNPSSLDIEQIEFSLETDGVTVDALDELTFDALQSEESRTVAWQLTLPEDEGTYTIDAAVNYTKADEQQTWSESLEIDVLEGDPEASMVTDFSEHPAGLGSPESWRIEWESGEAEWGIIEGEEFLGGKALQFEAGGNARRALAWEAVPDDTRDVEVLTKLKVPEIAQRGNHARIHLRSDRADNEQGYYFDLREEGFAVYEYPTADQLYQSGTPQSDTWYWIRFRAVGPHVKLKYWEASEDEPAEWIHEAPHTSQVTGWVGVGSFEEDISIWDVFSVATGGQTAPIPDELQD